MTPLRALATAMHIPLRPSTTSRMSSRIQLPNVWNSHRSHKPSPFSTSAPLLKKKRKGGGPPSNPRINVIKRALSMHKVPGVLRFNRLRYLRHWTIHRAAQLMRHKDRLARERELERLYNSMKDSMEELRVNIGDGGKLYRQASDRHGLYGGLHAEKLRPGMNGGLPIEYARAQTEGPPRGGWDSEWSRA